MGDLILNHIYRGNALYVLREFPTDSIDCCITSPPYWGLRSYHTEPQIWGRDKECEHQFGDTKPIMVGRNDTGTLYVADGHPRVFGGQKAQEVNQGSFCKLCGAWRGELGLEPTFQLYLDHLLLIFAEVKRVMKPEATLFVNIGDSYSGSGKGIGTDRTTCKESYTDEDIVKTKWDYSIPAKSLCGIPERFAIRMTDELGLIRRNTIIWYKRNCMPSSVKDRFTVDFEPVYFFSKTGKYYFKQQVELATSDYGVGPIDANQKYSNNIGNQSHSGWMGGDGLNRNRRCVWDIPTKPSSEPHFAMFPDTLVEPMLDAGCPVGGVVLDPFSGMGTVAKTAIRYGMNYIGIELSEEYHGKSEKVLNELQSQTRLEL